MPKKDKIKRLIEVKVEFLPVPDAEDRLRSAYDLILSGLEQESSPAEASNPDSTFNHT